MRPRAQDDLDQRRGVIADRRRFSLDPLILACTARTLGVTAISRNPYDMTVLLRVTARRADDWETASPCSHQAFDLSETVTFSR